MGLRRRGRDLLNLSAAHIAELVEEIAPLVRACDVIDVRALPPRDLSFALEPAQASANAASGAGATGTSREPGGTAREKPARLERIFLRISADPAAPRFHIQNERAPRHEGPLGPFFQRTQRELAGSRLRTLAQVSDDRIIRLDFCETSVGEARALVCELFGARPNIVLVGPRDEILEVLVTPAVKPGGPAPRLVQNAIWAPPARTPGRARVEPPAQTIGQSIAPAVGPSIAQAFAPAQADEDDRSSRAPLSWIIEHALGAQARETQRASAEKKLVERLERKLSRTRSKLAGLEERLAQSAQAERVRRDGELLKANLHALRRGLREIVLPDVFEPGEPERKITLDPKKSPVENLGQLFERARKLEESEPATATDRELARARIVELEEFLERARREDSDPAAIAAEAVASGALEPEQESDPRKREAPAPRLPYRTFTTERGAEIRVGRNARDNDDLTFHHARGNDVWLHSADSPGSHVVLRLEKGAEPHPEDLLDAAHLAIHFSPMRDSAKGDVHIARRKEVHKPRGSKPGLVTLSGGRILRIRSQPDRLARLLRSGRAGPEPSGPVS